MYAESRSHHAYATTQGVRLLQALNAQGLYVFSTADARAIAAQCGVAVSSITYVIDQLVTAGWVQRLRRGLFAGTGSLPGIQHLHPFAVATRLIEPSAISHWSALQYHGLTEQLPQYITVTTPRKVVTPGMRKSASERTPADKHRWTVGAEEIEFVTVHPDHFFGIGQVWVDQFFRVPIFDRERTLLDLCIFPRRFGGMTEVLGILEEHWASCDLARLIAYAVQYGMVVVAKRLGWTLETVGVPPSNIEPLLAIPATSYGLVDPSRPQAGSYDPRWRLRNNLRP
jgi:predicted transcriptional regulator of viral defense system